ncbi:hypothetical protein K443DRAFT_14299 [Laccaria amethystina LaAM-08-1]|uniref:Uncharacterized protein n=1 Tax=Laccaria amethystina LaAM-08-1 TaxID=1095629 RepID=A0A0C9X1Q5_9AGAR|nr:hypothetical protein K443DRAFT_14299 [Laccaria amethystina LaAM-08-1]
MISVKQEDAGNDIELPFDEEEQTPAPQEEFRQDIDNENPRADLPEPHNENLEITLLTQAETLHALLEDEPNPGARNDDADEFPALAQLQIEHVKLAQQFIDEISAQATFDNGNLDANVIEHLRNPDEGPVDISDPDI